MTTYRLETKPAAEGMFAVMAYEDDAEIACASSGPVFHSEDEAKEGITGMFALAWPAKDPFAVDASIGV